MDLSRQPVSDSILLSGKVKVALQIEPELRGDAKVTSQTQRGVRRDAPVAMNNFVDAAGRDADILRQAILRNAHRLEELLQENLAGVDGRYLSLVHVSAPNVVYDLHVIGIPILPPKADAPLIVNPDAVLS
jgi:hypothetical protein